MKITKENINDKWPEIEKYISENNKKEAKASYLEMARDWDSLSQEFTDEEKAETLEMMDEFISKINAQVETGMKKEASAQKKSRDNRKKAAAKGREHFATVRKNKKEAKKQKKDEAKVIKMNNTNSSKASSDPKPRYKVGDCFTTPEDKDWYYKVISIIKTAYVCAVFDKNNNEVVYDETSCQISHKGLRKYTPKKPKSTKPKVAEAPNWLKTIRSFVNSCGKEKTVASIRTQLININDRFDAKRNLNTPHIDLIREIQEKLLPYGNKKSVKKVVLPAWESFVAQCKAAINSISVSTKLEKEAIKNGSLAGFVPVWRIDYLSDNKMGFKTLAKAKEYIKSLPLERVKKMTRQHTFIYHDKDGEIDKVCNFNISGGKVVFKSVERY